MTRGIVINAKELWETPIDAPRFIVEGLITSVGMNLLHGKPRVGKSNMALNIALSVACGVDAIGEFKVEKSRVLYIAIEDNEFILKNKLELFAGVFGYNVKNSEAEFDLRSNLDILFTSPNLSLLRKYLDEDYALIIVDPLGKVDGLAAKINDYGISAEFASLDKMVNDSGKSLLFVHHAGKGRKDEGEFADPHDALLGSTGIRGSMYTNIALYREPSGFFISVESKLTAGFKCPLRIDIKNGIWEVASEDYGGSYREPINNFMYQCSKRHSPSARLSEIYDAIEDVVDKFNKDAVRKELGRMVNDGLILNPKKGWYLYADVPEIEIKKAKINHRIATPFETSSGDDDNDENEMEE